MGADMAKGVVHLKKDPFDVRIDRQSPWGNPFVIGKDGTRDEVIAKYQEWVMFSEDVAVQWIREHVEELKGKVLGCWCAPKPCHGDFLSELAEFGWYEFPGSHGQWATFWLSAEKYKELLDKPENSG